jgi:DNA-binding IclR family transcriptional regulator
MRGGAGAAVRLVRARGFVVPPRFGKPVVRDEVTLLDELHRTRERGYGAAIEEGEPGTAAIACAIHERSMPGASAVGTISVAGPIVRLTPSRLSEIADDVRATASELTTLWPLRRLGSAHVNASLRRAVA